PDVLDAIPGAVCLCAADGALVRYNQEAVGIWGRTPEVPHPDERFCGAWRLYWPDGTAIARENSTVARVLRTGESVRGVEALMERPDGERRLVVVNVQPLKDAEGHIEGALACFQDVTEQRRLEQEVRRRQEDLEDFFDNGAIGLHIVDADGVIQRANRAELTMLGYAPEEYIGHHIAEFHVDCVAITDILQRLRAGDRIVRYPARLRARDGGIRHVLITTSGRFVDGRLVNTRCFTMDVTEMHEAVAARRESDERLAVTYESAPVGIAEADASGRFVRVNEALAAITGYAREELVGRGFMDLTHPDDAEDAEQFARQVSGELDRYTVSKRYVRKDGAVIHVEVASACVRDDLGRFRYAVRVVEDVTERKRMQDRLRDKERQLSELLDALPAAVYTTDSEGRITFYNQAAVELAGRAPELGRDRWCVSWRLRTPEGEPLPHDACPMAVAVRQQRAVRGGEAVAERPDGSQVPFLAFPTPLRDREGRFTGAVNMLVDISERKQAETRQKILIEELNHRVKNTLATVQALLWQTARHAGSMEAFVQTFMARLMALARAHDLLTRRHWEGALLGDLVAEVLAPYMAGREDTLHLRGPAVELNPRTAVALAMACNELATNAVKYGALSVPEGRLDVEWSLEAYGALRLDWRERGGPPVARPPARGFGTRMVEQCIGGDLDGRSEFRFEPDGLCVVIEVPLLRALPAADVPAHVAA
ncbi:MAG TPA: PAS domain S-box protein, partial [Lysobacter sp.]|nr:PAS domain S-box protein [Lysobacter sp.]